MQPFFHHTDIVGTVRAVTDNSGAVVARYAYEPFGSLTTASGLVDGELHRFTGKPSDMETRLSYFNARYYDSTIGRFTSSDPAKDGLNWFVYCNNTPLTSIDADGKKVQAEVDGGAPAGQGGAGGDRINKSSECEREQLLLGVTSFPKGRYDREDIGRYVYQFPSNRCGNRRSW